MPVMPFRQMGGRVALVLAAAGLLSACQVGGLPADLAPIPNEVMRQVTAIGSTPASPIYVRIFKEEEEFELWKRRPDDTYALLDSYEICAWSGVLGPKFAEGDRQAPEGFYTVGQAQMNPNSSYHLSFNIGYPNVLDQALGRNRVQSHGAWRLLFGGLLCDDRRDGRNHLRARPRGLPRRPALLQCSCLSIPDDAGELR